MMILVATEQKLGTRIRRARERARMSQQQLADALQRSVRAVNDWENNRTVPRNDIGAIEAVLGVSLTDDTPPQPPRRQIPAHTKRVLRAALPDDDDYERVIALLEHGEGDANGDRGARAG